MIEVYYDCPEGVVGDRERAEYYSWWGINKIKVVK